jgi:hypothetical protein
LKKLFILILLFSMIAAKADQLQFEGPVPPDVDKSAMTAEYFRLYRVLAPLQRPDTRPVRIVYLTGKESAVQEYGLPEWGGGGAIGRDLVVIPTAAKPFLDLSFGQITRHELAHIVINRAYPSCAVPRWFHEGVAMTLSGELSLEENVAVSRAIFTGSLLPLSSIDSVNGFGRGRADLAYCESHLSVLFLIDQYGMGVLAEILVHARKTGGFWQGVNAVLNITPQDFEQAMRAYVSTRYKLVFLIADYPAFWALIALLFLVASGVAIVRKRKSLDLMDRAERAEQEMAARDLGAEDIQKASGVLLPFPRQPPSAGNQTPAENSSDPYGEDEYGDWEEEDVDDDDYILGDGIEMEDDNEDGDLRPPEEEKRP